MTKIVKIYQLLYGTTFIVTLMPVVFYIYYAISFYKIELDALFYNVLFCLINFSPLLILNKNISKTETSEKIYISKVFGGLCASVLFILVNVSFHSIMLRIFFMGGRGSSTSAIAYMYLPVLSYIAVGIGFFMGKLGHKLTFPK
jgi:hypothetical protein